MTAIDAIIARVDKLEPIPQVAHKVMSIVDDPESSLSDLTEVILYDQALTANLLKMCNSAYFALPEKVESVNHAIVLLGMDQIVDLFLLANAAGGLKAEQKGYDLHEGELWRYSVASALLARKLAERTTGENSHVVFTAALLKDIGKVVLSQYVADSFEKINGLVSQDGYSFKEAEKEVIGIDHAELGGLVTESWNFSSKMVNIIRNHHLSAETAEYDFETSIVYLADTLCMMMGIGVGSDGLAYRFHREVADRLKLSERDFQEIIAEFGGELQDVENLINF
ncbi:MAG: HDOD domain-containing protein [Thermodesulfobacteriota bacterium]|nr:HDOD domain-containing protein [Thermodesulfobacteriota bacterium]